MLARLSIIAAVVATFAIPTSVSAEVHNKSVHVNKRVHVNRNVNVNRNVHVDRNVHIRRNVHIHRDVHVVKPAQTHRLVVGRHYHGGIWYGTSRRFWRGAWYNYGVGPCWALTPFNYYVWICG